MNLKSWSRCLPGTGFTHIFIKTSQSAMISKPHRPKTNPHRHSNSPRFRPDVLIGDCDLSVLSVTACLSVCSCLCLFCLLLFPLFGTGCHGEDVSGTQAHNTSYSTLISGEFHFLLHPYFIFSSLSHRAVLQLTKPSVNCI